MVTPQVCPFHFLNKTLAVPLFFKPKESLFHDLLFYFASQIMFVFYLDEGMRNKHSVHGEKGVMIPPAQPSISVHANFLLLVNSGSVKLSPVYN